MRVKLITSWNRESAGGVVPDRVEWDGTEFIADPACRDYDWALVFDEISKKDLSGAGKSLELLSCPQENTVLVTCEPPTIKLYTRPYVNQFAYVLSTHHARYLHHPHRVYAPGCLLWMAGYPMDEARSMPEYEKTRVLSTVCSIKQQTHTLHGQRYNTTRYLAEHLPELDWYGRGVRDLKLKSDALSPYKYHLAAENYVGAHHWTDKISDPILGLCLTFYAGDPKLAEVFPEESFIPVPLGDAEATLAIIREAIRNNEYEKRLPALREARRLLVQKYNLFAQVSHLIREVTEQRQRSGMQPEPGKGVLCGRHRLRKNPLYAIEEGAALLRAKIGFALHGRGGYAPAAPDAE